MLDQYQKAFCNSLDRNLRLLAPAGSGKTHSLLFRCLSIYERQNGAARFLIVTFTRAARDELRNRLSQSDFSIVKNAIEVTTLNGWGWKRVRSSLTSPRLFTNIFEIELLGGNLLLPIIQRHASVATAKSEYRGGFARPLVETIDLFKSLGFVHDRHVSFEDFSSHTEWLRSVGCDAMIALLAETLTRIKVIEDQSDKSIYNSFFSFWRDAVKNQYDQCVLTLADQKYGGAQVIERAIRAGQTPVGATRYTDILIDEFQDINPLDLRIIKSISEYHRSNITVVGDDDQTIYEWRGATPDFILRPDAAFNRSFSTHILENNYRCPVNIVEHSKKLIANNLRREPKNIVGVSGLKASIEILESDNLASTVDQIADYVESFCKRSGRSGKRIALISRKRAQLIPYQILFASRNISFCAAEDLQIFLNAAFDDLISIITHRADKTARRTSTAYTNAALEFIDKAWKYPIKKSAREPLRQHISAIQPRSWEQTISAVRSFTGPIKGRTESAALESMIELSNSINNFLNSETVSEALTLLSDNFAGFEKIMDVREKKYFMPIRHSTIFPDLQRDMEMISTPLSMTSKRQNRHLFNCRRMRIKLANYGNGPYIS